MPKGTDRNFGCLVIPCYNEAQRFDAAHVASLLSQSDSLSVLLVDAGSTDRTLEVLRHASQQLGTRVTAVKQGQNLGKGEAVRFGMGIALERGAKVTGFADADFATPVSELLRLFDTLRTSPEIKGVMGSRVPRIGTELKRGVQRHLLSRLFATAAGAVLGTAVYDTQCGAKFFVVDDVFKRAISQPFSSRWVFDVELLGRLTGRFVIASQYEPNISTNFWNLRQLKEVPLDHWTEVGGSKLKWTGMAEAALDLTRFALRKKRTTTNARASSPLVSVGTDELNASHRNNALSQETP